MHITNGVWSENGKGGMMSTIRKHEVLKRIIPKNYAVLKKIVGLGNGCSKRTGKDILVVRCFDGRDLCLFLGDPF